MLLTRTHIYAYIAEPYVSRGQECCAEGAVQLLTITPHKVTAKACGTKIYRVQLFLKDNKLSGQCSCPAFSDFGPCKHIAAAGFAIVEHNQTGRYKSASREDAFSDVEMDELMSCLKAKQKDELIDIIVNFCENDPDLMQEI